MLVERGVQIDQLAIANVGPQFLAQATTVIDDQAVGGLEDARCGAVVLLQADDFGVRKVRGILVDVLDLRAAPAVNGLIVVADHHQAVAPLSEQA